MRLARALVIAVLAMSGWRATAQAPMAAVNDSSVPLRALRALR